MPTCLSLSEMVDLALGTPELGAVNFNVLHTLLHAMIGKLKISDVEAELSDEDKDFLSRRKSSSALTNKELESGIGETSDDGSTTDLKRERIPQKRPRYHALEDKVAKLEKQLEALDSLPSNAALFERTKPNDVTPPKPMPVTEMWQFMQIQRRVDGNEQGVSKLMSLVEDLMREMQQLKDFNESLKNQLEKLSSLTEVEERLRKLEDVQNDLNQKFSLLPTAEEFESFVSWPGLEDALKGIRKDLEPQERVVIEMTTQTDTPSRPTSSRPSTRLSNVSSVGPSAELAEILERLGNMDKRHLSLEERVKLLEDEIKKKADKGDLDKIGVPSDLLAQIDQLKKDLDNQKKNQDKDAMDMSGYVSSIAVDSTQGEVDSGGDSLASLAGKPGGSGARGSASAREHSGSAATAARATSHATAAVSARSSSSKTPGGGGGGGALSGRGSRTSPDSALFMDEVDDLSLARSSPQQESFYLLQVLLAPYHQQPLLHLLAQSCSS